MLVSPPLTIWGWGGGWVGGWYSGSSQCGLAGLPCYTNQYLPTADWTCSPGLPTNSLAMAPALNSRLPPAVPLAVPSHIDFPDVHIATPAIFRPFSFCPCTGTVCGILDHYCDPPELCTSHPAPLKKPTLAVTGRQQCWIDRKGAAGNKTSHSTI